MIMLWLIIVIGFDLLGIAILVVQVWFVKAAVCNS